MEAKLQETLTPVHLEVKNESRGAIENESHFHVLVVAEDERTCRQLKTWLTCGSQVLLERLFDRCVGGPWRCCKWLRSQS